MGARSSASSLVPLLPDLRFEANLGQFDPRVRYVARVRGGALVLADEGATLALAARRTTVTFAVAGGRSVAPRGADLVATRTNYFVGERARWRSNVPNFRQVTYPSVRDGIDVIYHGEAGALEYDVIVAPQADPAAVVVEVGGSEGLALTPDGDLEIQTPSGPVLQAAPRLYQTINGRREEIHGAYRIAGKSSIGFVVGQYDRRQPLIIDPVLSYATYLDADYAQAVAVDGAGHAYVAGYTQSLGLGTAGVVQPSYDADVDAYVAKLDPSGTSLVYATYLGGAQVDEANGIAVDANGHAYVTGETNSTDFPTTGALQPANAVSTHPGGATGDVFVTELSPDGTSLVYSTYLGGSGEDKGLAIAIDATSRAYVAGTTYSTDFPVPNGLYAFGGSSTSVSVSNAFVASIAAGGTTLVYSTCLGGVGNTDYSSAQGKAIAADAAGNAYVTGYADPNGFPLKNPLNSFSLLSNMFVTEVAAGGGSLVFSTFLEPAAAGDGNDGIAVDSSGNVYITGGAGSGFATTAGAVQTTCPSSSGGCSFVEKLAPAGTSVVYATFVGGSAGAYASGIAVDAVGTAYVTGSTSSSDFPLVSALSGPTATFQSLGTDAFVTAIDKTGGSFDYSTHFNEEMGAAIAVDDAGNAFVAGTGGASAFATCGAVQTSAQGSGEAFVLRIAREGQPDAGPALCAPLDAGALDAGGMRFDGGAPVDAAAPDDASTAADDAGDGNTALDDAGDGVRGAGSAPPGDAGSSSPGSPMASGCQTSASRLPGGGSLLLLGMSLVLVLVQRSRRRSRRSAEPL
jgi:hypothetical protein